MKVLVTGAAGQLGAVVAQHFDRGGHEVVAATRRELDVTRGDDVDRMAKAVHPDVVINCAAFTDVDASEQQQELALAVNAFAVRRLARAARAHDAVFVHFSTDFVFDGQTDRPYREDDRAQPQSVYASSKYLGECFAADAGRSYVLRVESLFGGSTARSSIDRIIDNLAHAREARVFVDRVVSPSYVEDVVTAMVGLIDGLAPAGLYHCVNSGHATWYEVGCAIAGMMHVNPELIVPVRVADVTLRAKRPLFAALSNEKLRTAGIPMPTWENALHRYLRAVGKGKTPA